MGGLSGSFGLVIPVHLRQRIEPRNTAFSNI